MTSAFDLPPEMQAMIDEAERDLGPAKVAALQAAFNEGIGVMMSEGTGFVGCGLSELLMGDEPSPVK